MLVVGAGAAGATGLLGLQPCAKRQATRDVLDGLGSSELGCCGLK